MSYLEKYLWSGKERKYGIVMIMEPQKLFANFGNFVDNAECVTVLLKGGRVRLSKRLLREDRCRTSLHGDMCGFNESISMNKLLFRDEVIDSTSH